MENGTIFGCVRFKREVGIVSVWNCLLGCGEVEQTEMGVWMIGCRLVEICRLYRPRVGAGRIG